MGEDAAISGLLFGECKFTSRVGECDKSVLPWLYVSLEAIDALSFRYNFNGEFCDSSRGDKMSLSGLCLLFGEYTFVPRTYSYHQG
jgi:hypothetical protein